MLVICLIQCGSGWFSPPALKQIKSSLILVGGFNSIERFLKSRFLYFKGFWRIIPCYMTFLFSNVLNILYVLCNIAIGLSSNTLKRSISIKF